MPFAQEPSAIAEENARQLITKFLNACVTQGPPAPDCIVDLEPAMIRVEWVDADAVMFDHYDTECFRVVAQVTMRYLANDRPARLIMLDVELPSLRAMLKTGLALPHLKELIVRVFPTALTRDMWDRGAAGGTPNLVKVSIEETDPIEDADSAFWVGTTKLPEWVAHLGAPGAVVTYKRHGREPQTLDGMIKEYEDMLAEEKEGETE